MKLLFYVRYKHIKYITAIIFALLSTFIVKEKIPFADDAIMTKVPGLDYEFDGGVYIGKTPQFPIKRWKTVNQYSLGRKENDIHFIYKDPKLYESIGKIFEPKYNNGELIGIFFSSGNTKEVGISVKIENKFYITFLPINEEIHSKLDNYNIK